MRLSAAIAAALDHLNHGVAVVDADLRVHHANRQLKNLCHRADGLLMSNGRLVATETNGTLQLQDALARAFSGETNTTVRLARLAPKRALSIVVRRLDQQNASPYAVQLALLLVGVLDHANAPPAVCLRQAYRLTTAEVAVAQQLLRGCDLHAVARSSNISVTTVRTHLRSLLAKTETHRQSELIGVLLQELGWMI